jgi:hypothetical protein
VPTAPFSRIKVRTGALVLTRSCFARCSGQGGLPDPDRNADRPIEHAYVVGECGPESVTRGAHPDHRRCLPWLHRTSPA